MAVYKRGDVYWYEFVFKGERVRESTHHGNQNVARQIETARKTALAKGEVGIIDKPPAPTLLEFSKVFIKQIELVCASKPETIKFYREKLKRLLEHGKLASKRLNEIDENEIENYKRARRLSISRHKKLLSPASVNRELATLRRLLRMAHDWKELDRVPRIKLLRGEGAREFVLSREMEPIYLGALPRAMRQLAVLLIDTGLRVGEGLKLDWSAVNLNDATGYLRVRSADSKNHKPRTVPLTPRVRKLLESRGTKSGLVFLNPDGSSLYHTWLNQQHAAVRETLNLPKDFVLHSLRHTFGTRLGETGADIFTIMRLMGHGSAAVSQKYVHPSTEAMQMAIERMGRSDDPEKVPTIPPTGKLGKTTKKR